MFRVFAKLFDIMQVMAVMASRGIHVAGSHRLAVNRLLIDRFLIVALDAFGDCDAFVVFPVIVGMDIGVALGAGDTLLGMHAGIMLGILFLVAALALYLLNLDLLFSCA